MNKKSQIRFKKILVCSLILISIFCLYFVSAPDTPTSKNWTIEGNKVYINDSNVYISAEPHTLTESGYVYFNLTSKVYNGNIDAIWGFDTNYLQPVKAEIYKPEWIKQIGSYSCNFNNSYFNYTTTNPKYFWCYINKTASGNGTGLSLIYEHNFDYGNLTLKTAYWNESYLREWQDISGSFDSLDYNYGGMNKWYYLKNVSIEVNKSYMIRGLINVPRGNGFSPMKLDTKYWFAIKPSSETIQHAISNNHFYALDPWFNSTGQDQNKDYLTDELTIYLKFDETSGNALDSVTGKYNGTNINTAVYTAGKIGNAINITDDGENDKRLELTNGGFDFERSKNWTVSMWYKQEIDAIFLGAEKGTTTKVRMHTSSGGQLRIWYDGVKWAKWEPAPFATPNEWHLITVEWRGSNNDSQESLVIYLDAVNTAPTGWEGDTIISGNTSSDNTSIGFRPDITGAGTIDELGIWNKALNDTEVADLYNNGLGITYAPVVTDTTPPDVNITYPLNISYNINVSAINYTFSDTNPDSCWYLDTTTSLCYQESANVSTSCGGLNTGIYVNNSYSNVYDGNWSSYQYLNSGTFIHINYTKPSNSLSSSLWQVKSYTTTANYSIDLNCWNRNELELRIIETTGSGETNKGECYNGTGWVQIYLTGDNAQVYEEAIIWNISNQTRVKVNAGTNFTNVISTEGSNTWTLYCNDTSGNQNSSSVTFFKDTIIPLISYGTNTAVDYANLSQSNIYVDVNFTEINFANITFTLNNDTATLNTTTFSSIKCYQESANVSTSCGGLNTGSYYTSPIGNWSGSPLVTYDGNWATGINVNLSFTGSATLQINYTKPTNSLNSSLWQTSTNENIQNLTIPQSCWDYNSTLLSLQAISSEISGPEYRNVNWSCFDGSWIVLRNSGGDASWIYEEAMIWNINGLSINWTNLPNGNYSYFVNITDLVNNKNSTLIRHITLDTSNPNVILLSPLNNTYTNIISQNLTVNLTDNLGFKNSTLYVYNDTAEINRTTISFAPNTLQELLGVVYDFVYNGIFKWIYDVYDWAGNSFQPSSNYTLIIDTINPDINITYPLNISYSTNVSALNYTVSDINLQACWYSLDNGVTNTTINCGTNLTGLTSTEGSNTWIVYVNDSVNNQNSSSVTFIKDTIYPTFDSFTSNPENASNYVNGQVYIFNSTVTSTNGTVGLEFNGINYTASNLTANIYNVSINNSINNLGAGTYTYYWWAYGNGTSKNYNTTQTYSYTVNLSCGSLETTNTVYTLTQNVTSTGTCFTILANNITLDCDGYEINYSYSGGSHEYGIYSTYNFTTIKNCIIKEGLTAGNFDHAIYFNNAKNGTVFNNTIFTLSTDGYGVWLDTSSNYNNISNNIINTSGNFASGIYLFGSSNNSLSSNIITTSGGSVYAIFLFGSPTNILSSNTITTSGGYGYGIYLHTNSNSNTLSNNTITTSGGYGYGFYIYLCSNNILSSNIVTTSSINGYGIFISLSSNNTLTNNQVNSSESQSYVIDGTSSSQFNHSIDTSNLAEGKPVNYTYNVDNLVFDGIDFTSYGQVIFGWSRNITITNSNFSDDSLNLFYTNISTITNNNINTSKGYSLFLFSYANLNNISSNIITTSGIYGYGIYLFSSSDSNTLSNNIITTSGDYGHGIYLFSSSDSNISSNTITTSGAYGHGVCLQSSSKNNSFSGMNIKTNNTGNAFYIYNINHNFTIRDSILNSSKAGVQEFYIASAVTGGTWNFTNVTKTNGSPITINWTAGSKGTLNMHWYLNVNVTNSSNGNALQNANVTDYDNNFNFVFSQLTLVTGFIPTQTLLEYKNINNTLITYYSNYTVNITLSGYSTSTQSLNMSTNRQLNVILVLDTTPPTWINLRNFTHTVNTNFSQNITATDSSGIGSYWLNDTNYFIINQTTGIITNVTNLSRIEIHWLNISVNDTLNNIASGIFYINITAVVVPPVPPSGGGGGSTSTFTLSNYTTNITTPINNQNQTIPKKITEKTKQIAKNIWNKFSGIENRNLIMIISGIIIFLIIFIVIISSISKKGEKSNATSNNS